MMKFAPGLPVVLVGVAVVIAQPQISHALSAAEVAKVARNITVRVDSQAPGSGVIIKQDGDIYTVLTAAHVVGSEDTYEVVTPDRARHPITNTTIQRLPNVDLALIQFSSSQSYKVAEVGNAQQISAGMPCYVAGFPGKTAAINEVVYNFTAGQITANAARPLRDGYGLVYSNATLPGMSGGAVLDSQGQLIGIHGRADTTPQAQNPNLNPDIYVKTGFNLGIPINTFLQKAEDAKLELGFATPPPKPAAPTSVDQALVEAGQALGQGESSKAVSKFNQVLGSDRKAVALHGRGLAQYQRGNYAEALADLNHAIAIDPYNALFFNSRGSVYLAQALRPNQNLHSGASRAVRDFSEALKLNPQDSNAYNNRGLANFYTGARAYAIDDFNQALRLEPGLAKAYKNRGFTRWLEQDIRGAILDLKQALTIDPTYAQAYQTRGRLQFRQGEVAQALADYDQAIQFKPKEGETYIYRGIARYENSEVPGAIQDWQAAIKASPEESAGAHLLIGATLLAQGRENEALQKLKTARQLERTWTNKGFLSQMLGKRLLKDATLLLEHPKAQAILKSR